MSIHKNVLFCKSALQALRSTLLLNCEAPSSEIAPRHASQLLDPLETKQEENEALNTNNGFCAVRQTNGTAQESVFEGYAALLSPHVRVYHKGIRRAMIGVQAHKHTRSFDKMFFEDARLVRGNVSLKEMCARLSHVFRGDPNAVRRATIGVPALRRARKKAQKKTQLAP